MKMLWFLLPVATFWTVFYIGHITDMGSMSNWWEIPLLMTLIITWMVVDSHQAGG